MTLSDLGTGIPTAWQVGNDVRLRDGRPGVVHLRKIGGYLVIVGRRNVFVATCDVLPPR